MTDTPNGGTGASLEGAGQGVPDALVEKAARAVFSVTPAHDDTEPWERIIARAVLAAVLPDATADLRARLQAADDRLAEVRREVAAQTLRDEADFIQAEMAVAWGGNAQWLTTGHHVASLVAEVLRDSAREVGDRQ